MGYTIMKPIVPVALSLAGTIIYTITLMIAVFTSFEKRKLPFLISWIVSVTLIYIPMTNTWCKDYCGKSFCLDNCTTGDCECPDDIDYCVEGCGQDTRLVLVAFSTIILTLVTLLIVFSNAEDDLDTKIYLVGIIVISLIPMYLLSTNTFGLMCKCDPTPRQFVNVSSCDALAECSCV